MPAGPVQMAARRQVIVDAAEMLIRDRGSTDFTMAELAREAGVSPATPFNLFESKLTLLYALLIRSLEGVNAVGRRASEERDAFVRLMRAAEGVGDFFNADAAFYRPLYQVLLGASDPQHRPDYLARALQFWQGAIEGLASQGLFNTAQPRNALAWDLMTMALGRVDLWVHGEFESADFPAQMAYGALALAVGLTTGAERQRVLRLMQGCRPRDSDTVRVGVRPAARTARSARVSKPAPSARIATRRSNRKP